MVKQATSKNSALSKNDDDLQKVELRGYVDARLRDLVFALADEQGIPVSECVAQLVAKALKRPDLAIVPRKRIGRRRKDVAQSQEK